MKEQLNENSNEVDQHLKCKKRFYRDEDAEQSIYLTKKRNNLQHYQQKLNGRSDNVIEIDEILIRETQAALKSLSGSWNSESNSSLTETDDCPAFPNLFEEKSRKMSTATMTTPPTAFNSNYDFSTYREFYAQQNGKSKSKKSKPNETERKFQTHDFNELVDESVVDDKMTNKIEKTTDSIVYEMNNEYRMPPQFSTQTSAFRPPTFDKKAFTSMAYQYTDGYYEKPFPKDDELNATDPKEYTTLQPAGIGSKAASVIQDITRDGVASVSVVTNSNTRAPPPQQPPTNLNAERTFAERPMAAFSPGSTNKGKKYKKPKNTFCMFNRFELWLYVCVCVCN